MPSYGGIDDHKPECFQLISNGFRDIKINCFRKASFANFAFLSNCYRTLLWTGPISFLLK